MRTLYLPEFALSSGEHHILCREAYADRQDDQHHRNKTKQDFERSKQHSLYVSLSGKRFDQLIDMLSRHCFGNTNKKLVGPAVKIP